VTLELAVGPLDRLGEIAVVVALDQMGDDLGVRFRAERVTVRLQRPLQLPVVLDDAVQDERQLPVLATGQRMGVLLGHTAMRRPAGVAETGRGLRPVPRGCGLQLREVADRADVVELVGFPEDDAGRVIAAVLEALEAVQEERLARPGPDVSDDSTHLELLRRWAARTFVHPPKRMKARPRPTTCVGGRLAELSANESGDGTTEAGRFLVG
jgi:hypothetical protein